MFITIVFVPRSYQWISREIKTSLFYVLKKVIILSISEEEIKDGIKFIACLHDPELQIPLEVLWAAHLHNGNTTSPFASGKGDVQQSAHSTCPTVLALPPFSFPLYLVYHVHFLILLGGTGFTLASLCLLGCYLISKCFCLNLFNSKFI